MFNLFKRLFCRHEYRDEYMAIGYRVRNGIEYTPYLRTCKKCGKQVLIVIRQERQHQWIKKLTDNEIIKALECCANCESCDYETTDCPLGKEMECRSILAEYALDLINRLQAENNHKDKIYIDLLKTSSERADIISSLKAENERLKPFEDKIAEFNSHIRVEDMLVFASSLEEWVEFCDNLKAEAYKECIEKIKEHSNKMELVCSGALVRTDYTITKDDLDNLLKELVNNNEKS